MAKIDIRITEKLSWLLSKPKRIKIAVGGRGSQKSTGVGDIMLMLAGQGERICCAREYQNSIDDSVHENLKIEIQRLGIEGFTALNNEIRTNEGGQIIYKGLARNITSLKSLAGVKRLWIEEGESVSSNSLKVLTPSIRSSATANENEEDPPEIWITMNRGSSADAVAEKYLKRAESALEKTGRYEDDLMMVVEVNWRDNPWFPPELEQERKDDYDKLTRAEYDHIWEGKYNDTIENSIILPEWFDAAIDAHIQLGFKPRGARIVSHDPSDLGPDPKGLCLRHGSVVLDVLENDYDDVNDGCDWATDYAIQNNADLFVWDCDGLGVTLRRQVQQAFKGKKIDYEMFKGSEGVENPDQIYQPDDDTTKKKAKTNKQTFKNKRAQYCGYLRDRYYATYCAVVKGEYIDPDHLISISSSISHLTKLRAETCRIPQKQNGNGLFQIMDKKEMQSKYGIKSPNLFDSTFMSLKNPEIMKKTKVAINIPDAQRL